MVRRENTTIFLDATEETTVFQLKKMLEGIIKKEPEELRLYNIDTKEPLDDSKTLGDCGYKSQNAKAQDPGTIGLAYKINDEFEEGTVKSYSNPPELPDVMKGQEGSAAPSGLSAD